MHTKKNPATLPDDHPDAPHNQDRYPGIVSALRQVLQQEDLPEGPFEWFEVHALASGELTYRIRRPRADHQEEVEGGYIAAS